MAKLSRYSPEVRERAVRLVYEQEKAHRSQWAATESIAEKVGCSAQTLSWWIKRREIDAGERPVVTSDEHARIQVLERENGELRRANEI